MTSHHISCLVSSGLVTSRLVSSQGLRLRVHITGFSADTLVGYWEQTTDAGLRPLLILPSCEVCTPQLELI